MPTLFKSRTYLISLAEHYGTNTNLYRFCSSQSLLERIVTSGVYYHLQLFVHLFEIFFVYSHLKPLFIIVYHLRQMAMFDQYDMHVLQTHNLPKLHSIVRLDVYKILV